MTTAVTLPSAQSLTCDGTQVVHWYCCDSTRAWCGADISDEVECPDICDCSPCVVCDDDAIADEPCECP